MIVLHDEFFNNDTANILQHISIFIELTGFILIIIEIYFADTADRIEKFLDTFSYYSVAVDKIRGKSKFLGGVSWLTMALSMILFSIIGFTNIYTYLPVQLVYIFYIPVVALMVYFLCAIIITFAPILALILSRILKALNYIAKDRALGALGVILSLIGLMFETYQVAVLRLR